MKTFLFTAFAMMTVSCSQATTDANVKLLGISSNGGQVMACENNSNYKPLQLLDYHEAEQEWGLTVSPAEGASWMEIAQNTLSRISRFDSERQRRYLQGLEQFNDLIKFTEGNLDIVSDNNGTTVPIGCHLLQAALRRPPELPGDKLYTISKPIWDKLDNANKAGLILHEIILNEAVLGGQETSRKSRYLNAYLVSQQISDLNLITYNNALERLIFVRAFINIKGLLLDPLSATYYQNGAIHAAKPVELYYIGHEKFESDMETPHGRVNAWSNGQVEFYQNGKLKRVSEGQLYKIEDGCLLFSYDTRYIGTGLEFDENERIVSNKISSIGHKFEGVCTDSATTDLKPKLSEFEFYENGMIKSGIWERNYYLEVQGGAGAFPVPNTVIEFHPNGHISRFTTKISGKLRTETGMKSFPEGSVLTFNERGFLE